MRTKPFARRLLRKRFKRFVAANWPRLLVAAAFFAPAAALAAFALDGYLRGLTHGVVGTAFVSMVFLTFLAGNAGAIHQLGGAWGEDSTRDELRRARRRGHIWGSVDGIAVASGDIDHVVVTRRGVLAVDSKWHSATMTRDVVQQDVRAARRAAERAQSVLRSIGDPRHVRPVVVVWSVGQREILDGGVDVDGVFVVAGFQLVGWLRSQRTGEEFSRAQARPLIRHLRDFQARVRPPLPQH